MNIAQINHTQANGYLSEALHDIGKPEKVYGKPDYQEYSEKAEEKQKESETDTDIVVMPDGSRVLMITMNIGGQQSSMSIEISKPTDMANDVSEKAVENRSQLLRASAAYEAGSMTGNIE